DDLIPGTLEGYALPVAKDGRAWQRNLRQAAKLLEQADWLVDDQGVLRNAQGAPFRFEILLTTGQDELGAIAAIWVEALKALGVQAEVMVIDAAQMRERTKAYDFDVTHYI